jgi:hypothetical protein
METLVPELGNRPGTCRREQQAEFQDIGSIDTQEVTVEARGGGCVGYR